MTNWGGLPPVDVAGWADYQRKRLQQQAAQRIAAAGAVASDWQSTAQRQIAQIGQDVGQFGEGVGPGLWEAGAAAFGGLQDIGQAAAQTVAQTAAHPTDLGLAPPGETSVQTQGNEMFPDDPFAGIKYAGVQTGRGINQAQGQSQAALDAMMGFGPQGPNLAAQALGAVDVATTPYSAPSRATTAAATNLGADPNQAAIAGGLVGTFGPGGLTSNLARREALPLAAAGAGAAIGVGSGIAQERPPDEILTRGFEGAQLGQGAGEMLPALGRTGLDALRYGAARFGSSPLEAPDSSGIVNAKTYDPTGINPVQGRLAARGKPGRAPGPGMQGPITAEEAAKIKNGKYGALYEGPPLSSDPFPPGPGPNGEYTIPHPTGPDMVAAPPPPGTYLSSDGYIFWTRVVNGQSPYAADWNRSLREYEQPKYPWDVRNAPPPTPDSPGYGRLPGIEEAPLAAPDWDTRLAGWSPRNGTDPVTLRHLLNRYATAERFPREAVDDLVPSHPDLATPEARAAAEADLNEALNRARARRSKNEDRAIASEHNVRREGTSEVNEAGEPTAAEGNYSYTSRKGITPDGTKGGEFHLTSSYEVASAIKFDMDPNVVSYQKGAGPRGRVRVLIDPKYGYNPNSEALKANSDPGPGSEVIYSPDWLVTFKDGSQKVVETKNAGIVNIPAWRIGAKTEAGLRHFEDLWGVGFMMMSEDQLGRPFLRELAQARPGSRGIGEYLARVRPGDVVGLQKKLRSAANASRGGGPEKEASLLAAAQHLMDLNSRSKYPASAALDDTKNVEQYMSAARAQAEWHNSTPADGTTFSVDGQNIPLAPGLGGYMVGVTPPGALRNEYPTHRLDPYRLAQFRHENAFYFDQLPDARVGTYKGYNAKGEPVTYLDVAIRTPDGQSAAEAANLFRQRMVYNIDSTTNVPLANPARQWVGKNDFTEEAAHVELQRILAAGQQRVDAGGAPGGQFPADYRSRGTGAPVRGLGLPPAAPRPRSPRPGAARGRGPVSEVPGGEPLDSQGLELLEPGGVGQPPPGGGVPSSGAPGLPADAGGRGTLGGPGGAGIAAQPGAGGQPGWRDTLNSTLGSLAPYGAARTGGERAFDLAAGAAGGVAGAATAPEDATWQDRAKRGLAGLTAASLAGPTARGGLGALARSGALDRSVGIAAGQGSAGSGTPSPGALSRIPELLSAIPLAAPTSLAANLTGGMARSIERVLGVAAELRPIDALVDLGGMAKSLVGGEAVRAGVKAFKAGPTAANPGMTGALTPGDLASSTHWLARGATGGVRANAATDEFWRTLNEAGARAQAGRRKLSAADADAYATRAGDFATFTGGNSVVAKKLTELKQTVRDPNASALDRGIAGAVTSMAPYVMMPERLLRATIGALVPVESATGMVRAFLRGDKAAAREMAGRTAAGLAVTTALTYHYFNGGITGDRPEDANEARRREARGERWNTIQTPTGRVPARYLGSVGMQANAIATTLDAARRAQEKGGDPGAVLENGFNGAARWMLDASYLSDLADFGSDVKGPEGAAGALRNVAAGLPSRITGPITGAIGAKDEYEREAENFPEQVMMRTGLREALPARIDPATGEAQRRRGSGWERYWGTRGDEQSPEGSELARLRVTPRVIGRTEEYLGATRSREDRRKVQQILGSETNRVVRRTMNAAYYKNAKDVDKKGYLEDAIREAAKAAEARLWKLGIRKVKPTAAEEAAELESAF